MEQTLLFKDLDLVVVVKDLVVEVHGGHRKVILLEQMLLQMDG